MKQAMCLCACKKSLRKLLEMDGEKINSEWLKLIITLAHAMNGNTIPQYIYNCMRFQIYHHQQCLCDRHHFSKIKRKIRARTHFIQSSSAKMFLFILILNWISRSCSIGALRFIKIQSILRRLQKTHKIAAKKNRMFCWPCTRDIRSL